MKLTEEFANVSQIKRKEGWVGKYNYRVSRCQAQTSEGIKCWEGEKRGQKRHGDWEICTFLQAARCMGLPRLPSHSSGVKTTE